MSRRNIHLIPSLGYGGAETFLLRLLPYLENNNIIVTFYNTEYDKARIKGKKINYITLDPKTTSLKDIILIFELLISLNKNDVVFSWLYISDLASCLLKCIFFWKRFKVIWNVRNSIIYKNYSFYSSLSFLLLRKIFMFVPKKIIFNSYSSMIDHIDKGYSKEKCITIHNGYVKLTKTTKPKIFKEPFKIAYVARYHPQKNHKLLIESIASYKENFNLNFKLFLAGRDIDEKNNTLMRELKKFNLIKNVYLCGLIDQKKVHELFSKCDITLLLSEYGEGFPNVIAEAMLYGTFPIVTDIGESRFIVNKFGKIIPPDSSAFYVSSLINEFEKSKRESFEKWKLAINDCKKFSKDRFALKFIGDKFNKESRDL